MNMLTWLPQSQPLVKISIQDFYKIKYCKHLNRDVIFNQQSTFTSGHSYLKLIKYRKDYWETINKYVFLVFVM